MHLFTKTNIQPCYNKSYKILIDVYMIQSQPKAIKYMDIETMPHAMYFSGNTHTVTKINHVPYQIIQYDDKGMF